jgi:hypothetical protein
MKTTTIVIGALVALGIMMAGWIYIYWDKAVPIGWCNILSVNWLLPSLR